ncbi:MAG: malate dehydrogenase [Nitrospirae bacterium RIFCSPHIGHO2_02_FULL_42_12]|nr:MAG: malate dehydrogenase [Nitrospirae bacterium RIFCSPHIGHO2_02_FULL_42_12]
MKLGGRNKVSIIGAGNVGATTAQRIMERSLADVVLFDIIEGAPQGKALDISEAAPISNSDISITGTNNYDETADSDIIVITAGLARKPGMSRRDLLEKNVRIVKDVTEEVIKRSQNSILIIVTNPMDLMTYLSWTVSGFSKQLVMGMGGALDSARFRFFISQELKVSVENIQAFVLGGHGDLMVPLARFSTVAGVPVTEIMEKSQIERIIDRTKFGGGEIVELLKTGSAYVAPAAAITEMVEAILLDKKKIIPSAVYLEGEYGIKDLFVGVPVKLGRGGVEEIIEINLSNEEKGEFYKSVDRVRSGVEEIKQILGQK